MGDKLTVLKVATTPNGKVCDNDFSMKNPPKPKPKPGLKITNITKIK